MNLLKEFSSAEIFLLSFFAAIYAIRFLYDFIIYFRLLFFKDLRIKNSKPSISVLITVRNQENNIKNNLPAITEAKYGDFEVIVVDDFSQDQSYTLLGLLRKKYNNFRISSLNQETRFSTKQAINVGLKAAKKEWIFIANSSMSEIPDEWLHSFSDKVNNDKKIVVGYSNVLPQKSIINLLYRIEVLLQHFQSFAYIKTGRAFVLEEDNLMFLKQKYFDIGGFTHDMDEEYGNLELIINKFIKKENASLNISAAGVVKKKRHINIKKYRELVIKETRIKKKLKPLNRLILFIDELTTLLIIPATIITLIVLKELILFAGVIILIKVLFHISILFNVLKRLKEGKIFISSLIYELIIPWYKLYIKWEHIRSLQKRRWNNN